jgi:N6-L-threonylcarbamoyladenine synthase
MRILGIETSCDETAAAVVENGAHVLSSIIASSKGVQAEFGGVFPEVAARKQIECIIPAVSSALNQAHMTMNNIDAIAVTKGPGLLTSLLVGVTAARALTSARKTPLIGVHHTQGHLDSPWLESRGDIVFPVLTLSVSGGHSDIWFRRSHTDQIRIGHTRDDAAGEAFDKGATLLGLPYPGGPELAKLAEGGNPHFIQFPRPLHSEESYDFSFSGLKTALKYALRDRGGLEAISNEEKKDIAASFQEAICKHLVSRVQRALSLHRDTQEVHVVGGVSANRRLREHITFIEKQKAIRLRIPAKIEYCTDNAAMIAAAGEFLVADLGRKAYETFETEASAALTC